MNNKYYNELEGAIAIIGISGAFSKANNIDEYWKNILEGKECIDDLTEEEIQLAGVPRELYENPHYVKRAANLQSAKEFDPAFFGYTPAEARLMDPQHRLFLEHSWKCLEDGNIIPEEYDGLIGVFGGCSQNNYLLKNLIFSEQADKAGAFQMMLGNDKDYLTTKVSYKLNLKGPSITMQTACSTSLTAIQQGCLSLLNYQSDMALCGGASVNVPFRAGYLYQDGLIFSPDGHCRAFDKDANGTVFGDGVGVILLKRFEEALEDGDNIYAIIRGSAINNDGSEKVGYTAPGVKAQAEVIATALAVADITADTIGYVEAHGTGTLMGDPIEMAALTEAFRMSTDKKNYCQIGSVKPNIGHLDAAAGVAGLIKACMVLKKGIIPPLANFTSPNPALNIENSPFAITTKQIPWESNGVPRRAGVSALGVGGTNVHVILEEFRPEKKKAATINEGPQLLVFSSKSEEALKRKKESFTAFLKKEEINLTSLAYTLQKKRIPFPYRDYLVLDRKKIFDQESFLNRNVIKPCRNTPNIAFLFTGQGSQYPDMGKGLYESIPFIRNIMDRGFQILEQTRGVRIKEIIYPADDVSFQESEKKLIQTTYTQPALFLLEYALALYLIELGLKPAYLLGHSLGEYTAACLSGIFTFEDALALVADRGRIMQTARKGSMISIPLSQIEIESMLTDDHLQVSVINAPERCVVSGTDEAVNILEKELKKKEIRISRLKTSHAYHSFLMDDILEEFASCFASITFNNPSIPIITNLTGSVHAMDKLKSPSYWVDQLRQPVNFEGGVSFLLKEENLSLLEIGPGNTLATLAKSNPHITRDHLSLTTIRNSRQQSADYPFLLSSLGKLWSRGHSLNWDRLYNDAVPSFISIPTYDFNNKEYWINGPENVMKSIQETGEYPKENKIEDNSTVEQRVLQVWREVFGSDFIGLKDNFYDLGGHSVMATQLLASLNDTFGIEIGIAPLLMDPTPANSLTLVENELARNRVFETETPSTQEKKVLPIMFPVQKGNSSKQPLFMVAGLYFNRYDLETPEEGLRKYEEDYFRYFSTLVKNIGSEQPVFGFRPKGIFLYEKAHKNVKDMAAAYIEEMKTIQPQGPYLIGGECVGGLIALEMAQQLHKSGEKVKHLIMLDTFYPRGKGLIVDSFHIIKNRIFDELGHPFKQKDLGGFRKFGQFLSRLQQFILPLSKKQRALKRVNYGNVFYLLSLLKYKPKHYSSPDATILANEEWAEEMSATLDWKEKYFNPLNIVVVPGTHVTSLTEFGPVTGKVIRDIIDRE